PAATAVAVAPGGAGPYCPDDGPPHRLRRLVHRRARPRVRHSLPRADRGPARYPATATHPIPGLRLLAAALADRRTARRAARLLEKAAPGRAATVGPPDRPAAAARLDLPRGDAAAALPALARRRATGAGQARGLHAVHDAAERVPDAALPLHRTGGRLRR